MMDPILARFGKPPHSGRYWISGVPGTNGNWRDSLPGPVESLPVPLVAQMLPGDDTLSYLHFT